MDLFSVDAVRLEVESASWNVAPSTPVRAIVQRAEGRVLESRQWGLVPHWAGDSRGGLINARAETVHELPAFRDAFARTRCIVPADGYYEWRDRRPHFICADAPLAFAGLRATWSSGARVLRTCAIITTAASASVRGVHDRMPAILPPHAWDRWLDPDEADTSWLRSMLAPARDALRIVPVSRAVNHVNNDGPHLVAAASEPVQGSLGL